MERTLQLTKIMLSIMGILFLIRLSPQIVFLVAALIASFSFEMLGITIVVAIAVGMIMWGMVYFLMYRRELLAQKILGTEDITDNSRSYPWFPIALRLGCVFAGLHCLFKSVLNFTNILRFLAISKASQTKPGFWPQYAYQLVISCVLIIIAAYLILGAPHFVRWQVKKTLEQCGKLESNEPTSD